MRILRKSSTKQPTGDAELLARFTAGRDDAAFAELVSRHLPLVLAVTRRRLGNSGLAEDAAQHVFITLSRKARRLRDHPSLAAWLQKTAVYEAANLARKEARHRARTEQARHLAAGAAGSPDYQPLDRALAALPDRDRQILVLHHFEKLTFAEIAGRLGLSEAVAQRRGHRALGKLADRLRAQGFRSDRAACATWLAGGFAPAGTSFSPELLARVATVKKAAALSLPWIPVAAALTLAGGTWAAVEAVRKPPPPPSVAVASPAPPRERPIARRFEPQTPDEDLTTDVREFIALAKVNSGAAWEFVKQRPQGAESFLRKGAVRALSDRDLGAAYDFLGVVDGDEPRKMTIGEIVTSMAAGNFEAAILWIDSLPASGDRGALIFSRCSYASSEYLRHDYAGALELARSTEVRQWLIREACIKASATDETEIEALARTLSGDDRGLALAHAASLLLQRGDPRGYELLDEAGTMAEYLPDISEIVRRDPRGILDWATTAHADAELNHIIRTAWHYWGRHDAPAAAAWAANLSESDRRRFHLTYSMVPAVRHILEQK